MRLLITTDTVGGVWEYTASLIRVLEQEGHGVLLAIIGEPSDAQMAELPEGIVVETRNHRLEWLPASEGDLSKTRAWLVGLARGWGADVVHLNQMAYTADRPFLAPALVAVHSDASSWFAEVLGSSVPPDWKAYARIVETGLRGADWVVAPSRYQADLVERHYGRTVDRVIPNGIAPLPKPTEGGRDFLVLTAGRAWDRAKGIEVLDRALAILGDAAPPAHLFGPLQGPNGTSLATSRLICHGKVTRRKLDEWMQLASIYVGPSLYEPFGLTPLEAAANGCALILSDIGSFREIWDGCAEFFPRGDAESLATKIAALGADPLRTGHLARSAGQRARSSYSLERFGNAYMTLYREILAGRPSRIPSSAPPSTCDA